MNTPSLIDLYKQFDFSNITGDPYDLLDSLKELHNFKADQSQTTQEFKELFTKSLNRMQVTHVSVVMKCFARALNGDASRWCSRLPDNSIGNIDRLQ